MPNIGAPELLVILLVALVVFGPRKLPELGKSLGHGLREFRKSTQGLKDSMNLDAPAATAAPVSAPTAAQPAPLTAASVAAPAVVAVPASSVTPQA